MTDSEMDRKVLKVLKDIEEMDFSPIKFFNTVEELLRHYPVFIYTEVMRGTSDIFHDLEKKVSPHNNKNILGYKWKDLVPEMKAELEYLLKVCNAIKMILSVIEAYRNKKVVLAVLEIMFQKTMKTGGGITPATHRVVLLYEGEGNISEKKNAAKEKKRKSSTPTLEPSLLLHENRIVESTSLKDIQAILIAAEAELASKKLKGIDEVPAAATAVVACLNVPTDSSTMPTGDYQEIDGFIFDSESDEFLDIVNVQV